MGIDLSVQKSKIAISLVIGLFLIFSQLGGSFHLGRSFVTNVQAAGPHDYFNALIARSDCFKAYSFRPSVGQASPVTSCAQSSYQNQLNNHPSITYSPETDTDPNRQDAAKVQIPVWFSASITLASGVDSASSIITVNGSANFENSRSYKIDNEIVTQTARSGQNITVLRGQFGTTPSAHSAGAAVLLNTNSVPGGSLRFDVNTDGSTSGNYLFTWDSFWTDSYVGAGLVNHKAFQIASWKDGSQWWETQTRYSGPPGSNPNPLWDISNSVAAVTARSYAQVVPPVTDDEPANPMTASPFIIKPNKWTRFWVLVEANAETDSSKFANVTTLASPVSDASTTTITINHQSPLFYNNPFTAASSIAGSGWPGRSLRIGSEIMTIVSGDSSGSTRNLTVVRGAYGTTPATHNAREDVKLVNDYVTMYMADEDQAPVKLYDRFPIHLPTNNADTSARGRIGKFWIEFNTSTQQLPEGRASKGFTDLVAYVRNFAVLKNPGEINVFLEKPLTGGVPPLTPITPTPVPPPPPAPQPPPPIVPPPAPSPTPVPPPPTPSSGGGDSGGLTNPPPPPATTTPPEDGTLIKDPNTPAIYIMEFGKKRPFASFEAFLGLGYKLENVATTNIANVPTGAGIFTANQRHPRGTLVNIGGTIYFLGAEIRYPFPSAEVFLSWGSQFKNVIAGNTHDRNMPLGPIVQRKQ